MKCPEVRNLVSAYLDSELDTRTSTEIAQHLQKCDECAELFQAEQRFQATLDQALSAEPRTLSRPLWQNTESLVNELAQKADQLQSPAPAASPWAWVNGWLWPHPRYWAAMAACWVFILGSQLILSDSPDAADKSYAARPSTEYLDSLHAQRVLWTELTSADPVAPPAKPHPHPGPQSQSNINKSTG